MESREKRPAGADSAAGADLRSLEDRRQAILLQLRRDGKVRVADLARLFGISEVTVRTDLNELEAAGQLERVHGGAIPSNHAYYNLTLDDRAQRQVEEKKRIAAEAAACVRPGDTVLLNAGTTNMVVAQQLRAIPNLTVVTNAISIACELGGAPGISVILLGGGVNAQYLFSYGDDAVGQLARYKADKVILSVDGFAAVGGITTYHHQEAPLIRQMLGRAKTVIVAADYSKIGRESFSYIDEAARADLLITNPEAARAELEALGELVADIRLV